MMMMALILLKNYTKIEHLFLDRSLLHMGNVQNVVHPGTDDLALSLDRHSGPSSSSRPNHGAEHTLFGPERKKILFHGLDGAGMILDIAKLAYLCIDP